MEKDPALLKRRLSSGPTAEKEKTQKIIMFFVSVGFIALLIVSGLDYRFGWSAVPPYAVITGDILVAVGFYIIFFVYKENSFTSATIEIAEDQEVISTGPYAVVRHPMYAGGLLYLLGTPLALGSYWGFLAVAAHVPRRLPYSSMCSRGQKRKPCVLHSSATHGPRAASSSRVIPWGMSSTVPGSMAGNSPTSASTSATS